MGVRKQIGDILKRYGMLSRSEESSNAKVELTKLLVENFEDTKLKGVVDGELRNILGPNYLEDIAMYPQCQKEGWKPGDCAVEDWEWSLSYFTASLMDSIKQINHWHPYKDHGSFLVKFQGGRKLEVLYEGPVDYTGKIETASLNRIGYKD